MARTAGSSHARQRWRPLCRHLPYWRTLSASISQQGRLHTWLRIMAPQTIPRSGPWLLRAVLPRSCNMLNQQAPACAGCALHGMRIRNTAWCLSCSQRHPRAARCMRFSSRWYSRCLTVAARATLAGWCSARGVLPVGERVSARGSQSGRPCRLLLCYNLPQQTPQHRRHVTRCNQTNTCVTCLMEKPARNNCGGS